MHSVTLVLSGIALLAVIYGIAHWRGQSLRQAFPIFALPWAVVALVNMMIGVMHAGYTVAQELPFLVFVFSVPCLIAWLVARRAG